MKNRKRLLHLPYHDIRISRYTEIRRVDGSSLNLSTGIPYKFGFTII